jgi:hypothetical protein
MGKKLPRLVIFIGQNKLIMKKIVFLAIVCFLSCSPVGETYIIRYKEHSILYRINNDSIINGTRMSFNQDNAEEFTLSYRKLHSNRFLIMSKTENDTLQLMSDTVIWKFRKFIWVNKGVRYSRYRKIFPKTIPTYYPQF